MRGCYIRAGECAMHLLAYLFDLAGVKGGFHAHPSSRQSFRNLK